jgi:hypothetical protein
VLCNEEIYNMFLSEVKCAIYTTHLGVKKMYVDLKSLFF